MPQFVYCQAMLWVGVLSLVGCSRAAATDSAGESKPLLAIGAALPDVTGIDQNGKEQRLSANRGHPTVVYFYPKDGTPGCTKEACAFRDVWKRFEADNVALYGISRDDRTSHERFALEHKIPFPLIADPEGTWAIAFGVPSKLGKSSRVSFLFDANGRLARVYPNVDPGVHADQVLADVAAVK